MHGTRRRSTILLTMAALLLVAGLAWGLAASFAESPAPNAAAKVVLKLGVTNDPDSLNPFVGYENSSYEVWCLNYDFIVGYGPDGEPVPGIAESWSVSPDGTTWTFKIRQGMKWQDGEPVTAADVAFTYNYIVSKDLDAYTSYTKLIKDAVAVDDYTCEVHCTKPKANMLRMYVYCFPEHIWSKIDKPTKYKMTYPIVGSGPFQTVEWKKGNFVRLVKNPSYWGGAPTIDEVLLQTYTNADTMVQEVKAGTIDGASGIPEAQYAQVSQTDGFTGYKSNLWYWEYLSFNCYAEPSSQGNPVLRETDFRQALNWALDKEKLVEVGLSGYGRPGTTMMPPDEWPADFDAHYEPTPEETYGFDIAKANQLLDAGGYKDSDGNGIREYKGKDIELRLWARSESQPSQREGKLIAGWFADCGLKIDFEIMDDGAMSDKLYAYNADCYYAPDYDIYLWDYYGYADPGDTLASFTTGQIEWWNDCCWSNKEYDALVDQQFSEMDPAKRLDMIHELQRIIYVDSPQVVLTYPDSLTIVNTKRWSGWVPFLGGAPFYNAYNIDSYRDLKPISGAAESESGGGNTTLIVIIVIVAIVVVAIVVWLVMRGRGRTEEA